MGSVLALLCARLFQARGLHVEGVLQPGDLLHRLLQPLFERLRVLALCVTLLFRLVQQGLHAGHLLAVRCNRCSLLLGEHPGSLSLRLQRRPCLGSVDVVFAGAHLSLQVLIHGLRLLQRLPRPGNVVSLATILSVVIFGLEAREHGLQLRRLRLQLLLALFALQQLRVDALGHIHQLAVLDLRVAVAPPQPLVLFAQLRTS